MEEAPEHGKESLHSAHAHGMNEEVHRYCNNVGATSKFQVSLG
jgi:hypothetical protein